MAEYTIITPESGFPIQPDDIASALTTSFKDAFDHHETEVTAIFIVRLCKEKRGWHPFSLGEIESYCDRMNYKEFSFGRLVEAERVHYIKGPELEGGGWIVEKDGLFYVTGDFIIRCYNTSPRNR